MTIAKMATCRTCGAKIRYVGRPGGEVRTHDWTRHPEVMRRGLRKRGRRAQAGNGQ